mmetsp:Transcript_65921/g.137647  ORF Transcript_65921/g.137647 Transcript_65921/m.137647 type:complete len:355 (-) Transcript_65921:773-1837(-)|eukprot:CAMPEP_0206463258 /NCGR_PEP_ID=MMETSP0324_2-20121206/26483_1 /ASSEMBLY_ACC=CAM_ASM_000836 /TAXON_ID=2866 /ORGANISM="Crypthecodinium cohnii, Strain Seligo" /LENGTH=354 /DNA_ID=CAMNT_0053935603 /DNA_START=47 /DNA_END=1111 /DNA_ORIENTATION=+
MAVTWFEHPDPLVWWHIVLYLVAIAWGSFVIGVFGVGGSAIFVPLILLLPGMDSKIAVGTIFLGVMPTTCSRLVQMVWFRRVSFRNSAPCMFGAMVGGISGQFVLKSTPEIVVAILVAVMAIGSGAQVQMKMLKERKHQREAAAAAVAASPKDASAGKDLEAGELVKVGSRSKVAADEEVSNDVDGSDKAADNKESSDAPGTVGAKEAKAAPPLTDTDKANLEAAQKPWKEIVGEWFIGVISAFLSSLSGTGGPLILFPAWMMWDPKAPMKKVIFHAGPFATVTIVFSSVTNLIVGETDAGMSLLIACTSFVFMLSGGLLMERLGESSLKLGVGIILIVVGIFVMVQRCIEEWA